MSGNETMAMIPLSVAITWTGLAPYHEQRVGHILMNTYLYPMVCTTKLGQPLDSRT